MLVFSIKVGMTFRIGPVWIKVLERKGNWFKVGIDAPRDWTISRNADTERGALSGNE